MSLSGLVTALLPNKIIFLQPSGGLSQEGKRLANLKVSDLPNVMEAESFSAGQIRFLDSVLELEKTAEARRSYVIASPLNVLGELFTTRGTGTLIRRGIEITRGDAYQAFDIPKLARAIETAFDKRLNPNFFDAPLHKGQCDGMQRAKSESGDWRIFWKGLEASVIGDAIVAAATAPDDFKD